MGTTHRSAVEQAIQAGRGALTDVHAPLLELCRTLSDQVDEAGEDGPSSRLAAAYLSALKDLSRALAQPRKEESTGKLAELRAARPGRRRSA